MKMLPAVVLLLILLGQECLAQDSGVSRVPVPDSVMQDTSIALNPAFKIKNIYASLDRHDAIRDSIRNSAIWNSKMHDTTIELESSFLISNVYADKDMLDAALFRRDSLIHARKDSLDAIGHALLHTADMQDTTIDMDPSFVVWNRYAARDSLQMIRDSLRALTVQAASMQDTSIEADPAFIVFDRYAKSDRYENFRDSVWASLAAAAKMQDTTILINPSFLIADRYAKKDQMDAIRDSLDRPSMMQDTVILWDSAFVIRDLYPFRDSLKSALAQKAAYADSVYADSLNRHWAGWKKYELDAGHSYTLNAQKLLKSRSRANLQYNIADFYLYLNGDLVNPEKSEFDFFAAGCLAFEVDDTLLLNSGLGLKVGIGVGIKIIQGRFTSLLHANRHNEEIYKRSDDDTAYLKSIVVQPVSQSLKLQFEPSYQSDDIISGEYQATYKKFYQKIENGDDEVRRYTVKIIFRCRVTGGLDSIKALK